MTKTENSKMAKDKISRAEYLQLIGLDTLAKQYDRKMHDLRDAMCEVIDASEQQRDYLSDLIWGGSNATVDEALKALKISVAEEADALR